MKRSRKSLSWEHLSSNPDPQRAGNAAESWYPKKRDSGRHKKLLPGRISEWGGFEVNLWEIREEPPALHLLLHTPNCLACISGCSFWEKGFLVPCRNSEVPQPRIPAPHWWLSIWEPSLSPSHMSTFTSFPNYSQAIFSWQSSKLGDFRPKKRCHLCTHSLFLHLLNWLQEIGEKQL